MYGIDKKVQFRHKGQFRQLVVGRASPGRSPSTRTATLKTFQCRFMLMCTGYYDYDQPLSTVIPGIENFAGESRAPLNSGPRISTT